MTMNQQHQSQDEQVNAANKAARAAYPTAIPLADAFIDRNQLSIENLPEAQAQRRLDVLQKEHENESKKWTNGTPVVMTADYGRATSPAQEPAAPFIPKGSTHTADTMAGFKSAGSSDDIIKAPRPETNMGVDPGSRKYIRGVLHRSASKVTAAAYGYLICYALVGLSFLPLPLIFIDKETFFWVVFAPVLFLPAFFIYVLVVLNANCPVCRQKQFVPKACHKHVKAHHVPVVGYRLPTAVHIVFFKWFRCIFCGTSIRMKE